MPDTKILIGDIGGTNARFAMAASSSPAYTHEKILQCEDFVTAEEAISHYLDLIGAQSPEVICLAAAGPVVNQKVYFSNNPWYIVAQDLRQKYETDHVQLLNDFEAIAYSIPFLGEDDLLTVGLPGPRSLTGDTFTVGIVGPGTGLGVVGLQKFYEHLIPIVGEASHSGFAPETSVQIEVLLQLREQHDRVCSERLVSGPGIENIYWALSRIHGEKRAPLSAAEIFLASDEGNQRAVEAVELFFEILGQVAGDIALAFGAADGMFIAGGITKRYAEKLENSRFRSGFEHKGKHRSMLEKIPTQLILHDQPGLLGAAYCANLLAAERTK